MAYKKTTLDSFAALGDPTRRAIFERVARQPSAVGHLARGFPVSRPAVSQHLRVLKEAGLVRETAEGTSRIYSVDPRGIAAMRAWLDQHWASALEGFADYANKQTDKERHE